MTSMGMLRKVLKLKSSWGNLPGGLMFKSLPSKARDIGSIAGRRTKIPYAIGQLSLCTANTGPMHSGACAPQLERSPHATARDTWVQWRLLAQKLRLSAAKYINKQVRILKTDFIFSINIVIFMTTFYIYYVNL